MRRRREFELVIRRGRRAAGRLLTVHMYVGGGGVAPAGVVHDGEAPDDRARAQSVSDVRPGPDALPRVGFIVNRAVGGAVVRNRVRRRLREAARARTGRLPAGSLLVIRANPRAADARQRDLAAELDLVLGRLLRRQVRA